MKPETLMDILGGLDDSLLTDAVQPRRRAWTRWVAVAAAVALTLSAVAILPHYVGNPFGDLSEMPGDASSTVSDTPSGNNENTTKPLDITTTVSSTTTADDVVDEAPTVATGQVTTAVDGNATGTTSSPLVGAPATKRTTKATTKTTTKAPTKVTTKAPAAIVTTKTKRPLRGGDKTTTKATVQAPTKAPTKVSTKAATKVTTKKTTKVITKVTTKATTKPATKVTVKVTTKAPAATPGTTLAGITTPTPPTTAFPSTVLALAKASYPKMPAYVSRKDANYTQEAHKTWWDALQGLRSPLISANLDLTDFYGTTMETLLSESNGKNKVFSPLNMYISLSMLAETTAGNSRAQLLNLLGVSDLVTLRERNSLLWNGTYRDDGAVTCRLANSLWLDKRYTYNQSTLDTLAKDYYASSFSGEMGSADYNTVLQDWLNEQTDGLLKKQVAKEELDANTAMALASTISFRAKWNKAFKVEDTVEGEFKTPNGRVAVKYMFAKEIHSDLYIADNFVACTKQVDDGYTMWFVLPKEGVTPEELAGDSLLQELLATEKGVPKYYGYDYDGFTLHLKVPKFDVTDHVDMTENLKKLGVTDILDADKADFSPLMDIDDLWLEEMNHAARVGVDEDGVTASAYTLVPAKLRGGGGAEIYELTLDRPFLFAITGPGNTMLFTGIVNQP